VRSLASHRAPESSGKRGKRIVRPAVLDPRVEQNRQARQIGKPEPAAYVDCAKRRHPRRQCGNAETGHDGGSDRRNAAADKNLRPGYACRIEKLPRHHTHAAGLGERRERQRLARAMLPAWRCEPREFFFGEDFPTALPGMQANDHRVEFPPVEALQQIARRSDPDLDQRLRVLRLHACDQGFVKYGERPIMRLQEGTGVFEKGFAPCRKLHVPGRPLDEPAAKPRFESLQPQADRSLRRPRGFCRARKAVELGNTDESLDGDQVERTLYHFR
jgi:hypothetical protein